MILTITMQQDFIVISLFSGFTKTSKNSLLMYSNMLQSYDGRIIYDWNENHFGNNYDVCCYLLLFKIRNWLYENNTYIWMFIDSTQTMYCDEPYSHLSVCEIPAKNLISPKRIVDENVNVLMNSLWPWFTVGCPAGHRTLDILRCDDKSRCGDGEKNKQFVEQCYGHSQASITTP